MSKKILIAGGGGFIGGHLANSLVNRGHNVRVADVKPLDQWYQRIDRHMSVFGTSLLNVLLLHVDAWGNAFENCRLPLSHSDWRIQVFVCKNSLGVTDMLNNC